MTTFRLRLAPFLFLFLFRGRRRSFVVTVEAHRSILALALPPLALAPPWLTARQPARIADEGAGRSMAGRGGRIRCAVELGTRRRRRRRLSCPPNP